MSIKNFLSRLSQLFFGGDLPPAKTPLRSKRNISSANRAAPDRAGKSSGSGVKAPNEDAPRIEYISVERDRWMTIKQTAISYPCFSEQSLRHLVWSAEAYAKYPKPGLRSNGLINCIVRPAGQRRILIDTLKFEAWLESQSVVQPPPAIKTVPSKANREVA